MKKFIEQLFCITTIIEAYDFKKENVKFPHSSAPLGVLSTSKFEPTNTCWIQKW